MPYSQDWHLIEWQTALHVQSCQSQWWIKAAGVKVTDLPGWRGKHRAHTGNCMCRIVFVENPQTYCPLLPANLASSVNFLSMHSIPLSRSLIKIWNRTSCMNSISQHSVSLAITHFITQQTGHPSKPSADSSCRRMMWDSLQKGAGRCPGRDSGEFRRA